MSLAQRFERRLEGLVGGAFARVFKGQVEPVEIGSALQREAADKKNVMGNGRVLSPNRYLVTLGRTDYDRFAPWEEQLTRSFAELVQEYLDENQWGTIGDVEVYLAVSDELHTGIFSVASRMDSAAPPRRRPHDSLSMPAVDAQSMAAPQAPSAPQYGQPGPQYAPKPQYASPTQAPYGAALASPYSDAGSHARGGAPNNPQAAQSVGTPSLVVDVTGVRYRLTQGSNVLGRSSEADLEIRDPGVSRRHTDVQFDGYTATAYDLGSTNGTTVNGHEVSSQVLRDGDVIRVGHTRVVFQQQDV